MNQFRGLVPGLRALLGLLWLCGVTANAVETDFVRDQHVEVRLLADRDSVVPGGSVRLGLEYRMDPGWHIYWRNPGESGLPPVHAWDVPVGGEIGPIHWPPPETYEAEGMVTYVYQDRVILVQELRLPPDLEIGTSVKVGVVTDWLMCSIPCIPGRAGLELSFPVEAVSRPDPEVSRKLDQVALSWPVPAPQELEVSATAIDSERFTVEIRGTGEALSGGLREVFPGGEFRIGEGEGPVMDGLWTYSGRYYAYASGERDEIEIVLVAETEGSGLRQFLATVPIRSPNSIPGEEGADAARLSLWILVAAFLGGVILNVMPCVFPVLGLKVLHLSNRVGNRRVEIVRHGAAYTIGVLVSFWILAGILLILRSKMDLTWGFQLQEPAFLYGLALVLLLFAMNLSGVFEIGNSLVGVGQSRANADGLGGSFFSGVLATTVSTPCSAPILGTALSAAFVLSPISVWLIFSLMGLGLAAPFVLLSLFPPLRNRLPRPGSWMETFKQFLAFPLYGTVVWLIWSLAGQVEEGILLGSAVSLVGVAFAGWVYGRFATPGRSNRVRRLAWGSGALALVLSLVWGWPVQRAGELEWETWSPGRVAELRAEGRPIYVDFTARWCLTCKLNKARVFGSEAVLKRFDELNVALLKADLTQENPEASREIERFGRGAVPMNLIYLPDRETPILLPELIGPEDVLEPFASGRFPDSGPPEN